MSKRFTVDTDRFQSTLPHRDISNDLFFAEWTKRFKTPTKSKSKKMQSPNKLMAFKYETSKAL